MSETLNHRHSPREVLKAEFEVPARTSSELSPMRDTRVVLPLLGGSGPDEYDFSPSEYLVRRWRKEIEEKRRSPAYKRRLRKVQDLFH